MCAETIAAVIAIRPRTQVLDVTPDERLGGPGRCIWYAYEQAGQWIIVQQWMTVTAREQVHLTASVSVDEFEYFRSGFVAIAESIVIAPGDSPSDRSLSVGARAMNSDPVLEPALDDRVSARLDESYESLSGVPGAQPRPVGRWLMNDSTLQHLFAIRARGMVGGADRRSADGMSLRELGLTNRFGAPVNDGLAIARLLERPSARFGALARHAGLEISWTLWSDGTMGLVRGESSVAELPQRRARSEPALFDRVGLGRAAGHLVAWMGLSPAWTVGNDTRLRLPADLVDRRVDEPGAPEGPSPIDDWAMCRLWAQPAWVRITVWRDGAGRGVDVVAAGDAGYFRVRPMDGGQVELFPVPSGTVLLDALHVLAERPTGDGRSGTRSSSGVAPHL
ncbi:hypothetical protein ASF23_11865 [Curtobacterium sp. Leaf261]|nr:hypothetical protein ASF23_11865 [Curtobacterium sp. Leaf261]